MNRYKFSFNDNDSQTILTMEVKGYTYKDAVNNFRKQTTNANIVEVWVLCGED